VERMFVGFSRDLKGKCEEVERLKKVVGETQGDAFGKI
jgi:hypothetical protein